VITEVWPFGKVVVSVSVVIQLLQCMPEELGIGVGLDVCVCDHGIDGMLTGILFGPEGQMIERVDDPKPPSGKQTDTVHAVAVEEEGEGENEVYTGEV
jgi:hypothetical protein